MGEGGTDSARSTYQCTHEMRLRQVPALARGDVQCCMHYMRYGKDGHLEFHLCERMQCHWVPKIRFLASSRSPKSFSYSKVLKRTVSSLSMAAEMKQQVAHSDQSRSAEQGATPIGPCWYIVWKLKATHRFDLRVWTRFRQTGWLARQGKSRKPAVDERPRRAGADVPPAR